MRCAPRASAACSSNWDLPSRITAISHCRRVPSADGAAAGKRQILRRHQGLDSRAQRARLFAGALRRDSDLHGRRSQPVDGIGERRRAILAGTEPAAVRAVARRPCRLQHARHHRDRQHARHVGRVPVRRARPRRPARRPAPRPDRSRSARSVRNPLDRSARERAGRATAASRSPTCARSTNSGSAS